MDSSILHVQVNMKVNVADKSYANSRTSCEWALYLICLLTHLFGHPVHMMQKALKHIIRRYEVNPMMYCLTIRPSKFNKKSAFLIKGFPSLPRHLIDIKKLNTSKYIAIRKYYIIWIVSVSVMMKL